MKQKLTLVLLAAFLMFTFVSSGFANHGGGGHSCPMGSECGGGYGKGDQEYKCPIVAKLMKKAEFYLDNQQEIGLSEEQATQIKAIKLDVQKAYARQGAEMQIFELDLQAKMSEPKVDVEGLNAMIDSAMQGMSKGAKESVANYAKLKAVLTEDQAKKAKEVWIADSHR